MSRLLSAFLILTVLALGLPANAVEAQTTDVRFLCPFLFPFDLLPSPPAPPGTHLLPDVIDAGVRDGSAYCVWAPDPWDGKKVVLYAHGYVDPLRPDGTIPTDQLVLTDPNTKVTVSLPDVITSMGYALVVPSYFKNGLAVKEGVAAVQDLGQLFRDRGAAEVYVVGASEGGLVAAYAVEQHSMLTTNSSAVMGPFTAGVSTCGPVGDFVQQINYWGDFRVAYDYYFGRTSEDIALKTNPISIDPINTILQWGTLNSPIPEFGPGPLQIAVLDAINNNLTKALKLIASGKAPIDPLKPKETIPATILGILDYSVKATDEAREEFSGDEFAYLDPILGNPYDNTNRWIGTWFDLGLNNWKKVNEQYAADPKALAQIKESYQTNGRLTVPLVTLHTTGDPIVPYWHELIYAARVWRTGSGLRLASIPIPRYGHCAFKPKEAIFGFALAVLMSGHMPTLPTAVTSAGEPVLTQQEFDAMRSQYAPIEPKFYYIPNVTK